MFRQELCVIYSYFEKGCRKKKNIKVHATRPKGGLSIHWNFAYWPRGNHPASRALSFPLMYLTGQGVSFSSQISTAGKLKEALLAG